MVDSPSPQPFPTRGEEAKGTRARWVKIRDWRRGWSHSLGVDLRVAEYADYKFLLEKRRGAPYHGKRWVLKIYVKNKFCVRTGHPNLAVAKAKAEEWLNKNYGTIPEVNQ
jgi:hypothetical protein